MSTSRNVATLTKTIFCRNALRGAPQSTMSQQKQHFFWLCWRQRQRGSRIWAGWASCGLIPPCESCFDAKLNFFSPIWKSGLLYGNKLWDSPWGGAKSLLTSFLSRNSSGPGSRASAAPPAIGPSCYRESEKERWMWWPVFSSSPASICSLDLLQHLDLAALSLVKQMQELVENHTATCQRFSSNSKWPEFVILLISGTQTTV